ncbi:MAG: methenyltetrahydromethanopterin cyclohydrolase, partial [Pirellulales bacterium]|nr:methenyltetrahydromethanopterin cyclohydrolase [Pirellulales bacterium]
FKAMASGPIRAAIAKEPIFEKISRREQPHETVGLLETNQLPPESVCHELASLAGLSSRDITLLVAPTKSPAGVVQVVARSLETALHQLHEHGFDLERIVRGMGVAPLPPEMQDSLAAVGCVNDAILYGGIVQLEVTGDDGSLEAIGPHAVSSYSNLHGNLFSDLFKQANQDFYALDPALFAPAILEFKNLDSGNYHRFGLISPDVIEKSFSATH